MLFRPAEPLVSLRFLGRGLRTSEHSEPLLWHGMQPPSSSSPAVVHLSRSLRQESHGLEGELAREWGAEASKDDMLPLPRSNLLFPSSWCFWRRLADPDNDAELDTAAIGPLGLGAMAIGAVLGTAGELDMVGGEARQSCAEPG